MKVEPLGLPGVFLITPTAHGDARGFFMESYRRDVLLAHGIDIEFVQDNHSLSAQKGTVRGLHYQEEPMAQTKLLRVLLGSVYDVAVDIRRDSPTFGKWVGVTLSAENRQQILIPKGFAHGFCTLETNTQIHYKVDAYYSAAHDRGIRWNDPAIGIDWPVTEAEAVLSAKDATLPMLKNVNSWTL
ncbi:dTDP-4-dehydrorhamnose 3,5-epimerase [Ferroacidibacillus organovorans]|uniref:dTDP-4-dehydrorhamnose 3,5-epimerase n=1 Tax=Ferroacidibacillus organovorans TaxID=1765683 RepID=A0A1V4ER94_9BACL|nr:dTDP-4-dehydrorhamnose 3,5-epimerase [Ferroacidibacillus organovorans]OPG15447.1 dTDP-4-dehydrorhamnose 3,5-epimerase [Ferroacidibacillus organovorans]